MKKCLKVLLLNLLSLAAIHGFSQGNDAKKPAALNNVLALEGYWESYVSMTMGNKENKFMHYVDFQKTADNNGLVMYEWSDSPAMGKLRGTSLIGYNPYSGKVHWFTVDNMGTTHEHVGDFTNNNHFKMEHKGIQEGKEYVEVVELNFQAKDMMTIDSTATLDAQIQYTLKGTFTRKAGKNSKP